MFNRYQLLRSLTRWAGIAALLLTIPTHAAGLNDTGIITCSNADINGFPCPVAGFPGQDAEFGTNTFDFTKLDAAGNDLPATATNHTCVRDNVTGLIWEVKTNDGGLRDQNKIYTFDQAENYVKDVNATHVCGFKDWRMPDVKELLGITDQSHTHPAIDFNYFLNTPNNGFWSVSPYVNDLDYLWNVDFNDSSASVSNLSNASHVRLVRGGQFLDTFVDNGNGTVTQMNTGLMWAKCSEGQTDSDCTGTATEMNWSAALTAANESLLGGYSDWRLPNLKELQTLVDYSRYSPAIDSSYFPNTPGAWFWSGSPYADNSGDAWIVDFYGGYAKNSSRISALSVRLVRSIFYLTVNKIGNGTGTVTSSDGNIKCGATCIASFNSGNSVILTAIAASGSIFSGWSCACTNKTGDCTVNMNAAQTVAANFSTAPILKKLSINKSGNGTITSSPAGISCGATCNKEFAIGTVVTLTAKPDTGATFIDWNNCSPLDKKPLQCTVKLATNKNVTATFGKNGVADIKITEIKLTPTSPDANGIFSATISVTNQGSASVSGGYLDIWANQPTEQKCGAFGEEWIDIGVLAAGATKTFTLNLRSNGAGAKKLRAFADSWCQAPESNEDNNQLTKKYTVK
ncbi:DUF1566 domain-containing protein [Chromatium okenii]|uniref:Lcl domain-containing protein n=1 Tax=Chromatium okenii TaxID=61644 RepID=UPI001903819C|nr:DUF1566 domain-containing protein [Chromatium okenii]